MIMRMGSSGVIEEAGNIGYQALRVGTFQPLHFRIFLHRWRFDALTGCGINGNLLKIHVYGGRERRGAENALTFDIGPK